MRLAIIADIHGNQVAFQAVLHDLRTRTAVDQIILAGDYCTKGPRPREVLETAWSLNCPMVMGNVDRDLLISFPSNHRKYELTHWTRQQIGLENMEHLRRTPFSHVVYPPTGKAVMIVHANPLNLDEKLLPSTEETILKQLLGSLADEIGVVVFGHHHVAFQREWKKLLLVDAGSCGLPRDNDLRASYVILEQKAGGRWEARHHRVIYDIHQVVHQLRESSIPQPEKRVKTLLDASYEKPKTAETREVGSKK